MEIALNIEYDDREQFVDTSKLARYLLRCIKTDKNREQEITLKMFHNFPQIKVASGR